MRLFLCMIIYLLCGCYEKTAGVHIFPDAVGFNNIVALTMIYVGFCLAIYQDVTCYK